MLSPPTTLSPERDTRVGASFLPILMAGKTEEIMREWQRLTGDPAYVPPNFDNNWPVALGRYLEPMVLDWHERKHGPLTRRGEWVPHPHRPWLGCTLDGYRETDKTVLDAKVVGQWRRMEEVIAYYTPQMVVQRDCVGAENAALLIVHGGSEPVECPVTWTPDYEAEVWTRLDEFWDCVLSLTPPGGFVEKIATPAPVKTYEMSTSNAWCANAAAWIINKTAAQDFNEAAKEIKALVPADAIQCFGGGVSVVRNKAGSLTIKESA
jgi:hypothetical protein